MKAKCIAFLFGKARYVNMSHLFIPGASVYVLQMRERERERERESFHIGTTQPKAEHELEPISICLFLSK